MAEVIDLLCRVVPEADRPSFGEGLFVVDVLIFGLLATFWEEAGKLRIGSRRKHDRPSRH